MNNVFCQDDLNYCVPRAMINPSYRNTNAATTADKEDKEGFAAPPDPARLRPQI